ncbi:hypothetical protein CH363_14005 [Leptospira haakeii]|uniref:Uncharacterized protein n=1 Tax=Leptospira haakeii TaxID=2023198 RepID=A0ABX4PJ16_9LEPT|nr:hypothetical protein CH363_14005 [Leptospira haakeii]PKA18839.1 hypothetical protein CH377_15850 [Leptospira haakeii]
MLESKSHPIFYNRKPVKRLNGRGLKNSEICLFSDWILYVEVTTTLPFLKNYVLEKSANRPMILG